MNDRWDACPRVRRLKDGCGEAVLGDVIAELIRNFAKVGDQSDRGHVFMLAVLTEGVGEAARAVIDWQLELDYITGLAASPERGNNNPVSPEAFTAVDANGRRALRDKLVQVAAVAVQMIGHIDSEESVGGGSPPGLGEVAAQRRRQSTGETSA